MYKLLALATKASGVSKAAETTIMTNGPTTDIEDATKEENASLFIPTIFIFCYD
jgi:hypothetical protein